ncbi:MAG: xanthine dehydrogenase family protein molybdopterin-binding subunit [Holophagales bacterium]|nr:xanthine dehydrogenase family protein molybdopterin-binding subunit [Holophagales bacterium]MYF95652.1 xanthine dehydrogenase family protein molybdopterin-binding subunit [Holophagales bacterium]
MTAIGTPTKLLEGAPKVKGSLRFCGDLDRPGLLHARLVTSPHAHAEVLSIDTAAAEAMPGVAAVITAADLPALPPSNRATLLLARERAIFVGHPVALVLAENEAVAADAADAVVVDYQPLEAVVTIEQAEAPDAQAVWPDGLPGQSEEAAAHGAGDVSEGEEAVASSPNVTNRMRFERGDLERGYAEADAVVERVFRTASVHQSYIEPHASLIDPDPMGNGMTVYCSTQAPFFIRDAIAGVLRIPQDQVKVIGTPVGGGFGAKFVLYEPLLALAAVQHQRPVRLVMTRTEEMLAATPAPSTRITIRAGAKRSGELTALEAELAIDCGCFPSSMTALAGILLGSSYQTPNQAVGGFEVTTNKPSVGAYRAPLAPQAAFVVETVLDQLARELDLDPVEFRLQNASEKGNPMASGMPWAGMGQRQVLEALRDHPAWQNREQARAEGRGVGIALGAWPGGTEPASAACALQTDGTLKVHISTADINGTNTSMALMAAEAFGLDPDKVTVATGDTSSGPYAGASGGSKTIYTVGPPVIQAAREARQQTLELAAQTFEADPEDLEIVDGAVQVKGSPDKAIPLKKIAQRTMRFGGRQAPVFGHGRHAQTSQAPGFCAQLAEVSVDQETGRVDVDRVVVIQDCGKAINPAAVEGQMMGGALQGIGWALYEEMAYSEDGQLLTATLNDYALPHSAQSPTELETVLVEVPSDHGPFGARGVGEPPVVPTAAAIANAIADACGARPTELPMTPPRVLQALNGGQ